MWISAAPPLPCPQGSLKHEVYNFIEKAHLNILLQSSLRDSFSSYLLNNVVKTLEEYYSDVL